MIIVGGSGGIGSEIIEILKPKYKILSTYNKTKPTINHENVEFIQLNLESNHSIQKFCNKVLSHTAQKLVYLNLATVTYDNLFVKTTAEEWRSAININIMSNIVILKQIIPKMMAADWGRIILTTSIVADAGQVGAIIYSTTKHSLIGFSSTLAKEYGRFGITSNILKLGFFNRGLINKFNEKEIKSLRKRIPSKSLGNASHITESIEYLIKNEYASASIMTIDGAFH